MLGWLLFGLGTYHGLNPAMGWLFATALGLQEKNSRAVVNALLPLGAGHLLAVGLVVGLAQMIEFTLPLHVVKLLAAGVLISFGLYRLVRRRHPRWVGMKVNSRDLTLWSFLMASAHGAGLMLLPFVVSAPQHMQHPVMSGHVHHEMMAASVEFGVAAQWWIPVGLHTLGYLLVTALLALLVYYKVGVAVLRRTWFNLEFLWVAALIATGVLTIFI